MNSSTKPVIAAFDFDKTLTTCDSLLPFLFHLIPWPSKILNSLRLLPTGLAYKLGMLENHTAKQKLLRTFLTNYSLPLLQSQAQEFAAQQLPQWVKPEAMDRVYWHHRQGHRCILVSAGLEIYLQPWAKQFPFETVLATRLEHNGDQLTGNIHGRNCFGQEKVNRLLDYIGLRENFTLYAYGDSRGDKELLAAADFPFYRHIPT